jgi:GH15 family glucan-1,4-alpha-glucosidase
LYFIFFNKTKQNPINENNKKIIENPIIIDNTKMEIELSPVPNSKLNSSDIENIAKNLKKNLTIEEVVKLIFEKNPIDIKKHYENQLDLYSKKIFELNKNCFEQKNGVKYYKQDTIKDIPSFNDNNQI